MEKGTTYPSEESKGSRKRGPKDAKPKKEEKKKNRYSNPESRSVMFGNSLEIPSSTWFCLPK